MNARVQISDGLARGTIDDFRDACDAQRWFVDEGWISKQVAVDGLQFMAEHAGYVAEFGRDQVQRWMSDAFAPVPDLPSDYAAQLIKRWELDDPRDRWKHTGELPPPPEKGPKRLNFPIISESCRCPAPQSTKDAFKYVVALGDAEHLRRWLRDHAAVAHVLVNEVA